VLVADDTSLRVDKLHSGEFAIAMIDSAAYKLSGLSYPMKFNLHDRALLPYASDWSGEPHGQLPRLCTLHPSLRIRFRATTVAAEMP
jgi:hypothetical protein